MIIHRKYRFLLFLIIYLFINMELSADYGQKYTRRINLNRDFDPNESIIIGLVEVYHVIWSKENIPIYFFFSDVNILSDILVESKEKGVSIEKVLKRRGLEDFYYDIQPIYDRTNLSLSLGGWAPSSSGIIWYYTFNSKLEEQFLLKNKNFKKKYFIKKEFIATTIREGNYSFGREYVSNRMLLFRRGIDFIVPKGRIINLGVIYIIHSEEQEFYQVIFEHANSDIPIKAFAEKYPRLYETNKDKIINLYEVNNNLVPNINDTLETCMLETGLTKNDKMVAEINNINSILREHKDTRGSLFANSVILGILGLTTYDLVSNYQHISSLRKILDFIGLGGSTLSFWGLINTIFDDKKLIIRRDSLESMIDSINFGLTLPKSTVTDIDGNVYQTVKIGNQWWMAENLKVTRYCNGDIIKIGNQWWKADNLKVTHYLSDDTIPNVTDPSIWANLTIGAYCNYNNDDSNADIYGSLYNWNMVNDCRSIAPVGWHVPTNEEWQILVDYCGGDNIAGGKLKETGTIHWKNANTNATNKSCFSALPGGYRDKNGNFCNMSKNAYFWSSTEHDSSFALYRQLKYDDSEVFRFYHNKQYGFSVRCVKD